ncbi:MULTISPECIES: alpha/beta hydrolase [unclassified Nocardia]|uniref:alpha/beta hydrolase n=1 Tax=unclassified Nocardia TaxID=2637762 RepID=UPI0033B9088B
MGIFTSGRSAAAVATGCAAAAVIGCAAPEQVAPSHGTLPDRIGNQRIEWHDCDTSPEDAVGRGLAAVGARCGEFQAPVDYARPFGPTVTIAVALRPASDPVRRLGTLVVETGGPGPSREGVPMLVEGHEGGYPAAPELAQRYDLVALDPRFFGASSPLECGWPTGEYLGIAQGAPTDRAGFDRTVDVARDLAQRCAPHRELLPHASTRAVARDLDLLRTLLGQQRLSYLGWSWGSYLGAVYLQMFGDTVDRMVLDSALDPRAPGPDLTRATAPATAAALADWARWAADHDPELGLGTTQQAVLAEVDAMAARIAERPPVVAGITLTADMVPGLLLTVDDTDESYTEFGALVRALSDASRGLVVDLPPSSAAKLALYAETEVIPEFGFSATVANQCADRAARDVEAHYADIEEHRVAEPLFGALARHLTPCAVWPTRPVEPATEIDTSAPALLVGAEGDPVAPIAGQRALRAALSGSRSVTMTGVFRHGVYLFERSRCVDTAVERYLLDGVLPAADLQCRRE